MNIRYVNPVLDGSGYASCGRSYIKALVDYGHNVTIDAVSFEEARPDLGEYDKYITPNIGKNIDVDVSVVHLTPEHFPNRKLPGGVNVGLTVWETTRIPELWVRCCNNMDAIIVPCEWNKEVFIDSGVTVPIYVVPHVVDYERIDSIPNFYVEGVPERAFKFYYIAQLTERKGIVDTLKAYWHAFSADDNVAFILKTYRSNYSESEVNAVVEIIKRIKQSVRMPYGKEFAPVFLITNMLSTDEIYGLHKSCDCFVSLNRAEGFGLPEAEAGLCGNPVIATRFGGVTQFLNDDNSLLVDYNLTPVSGMPHIPWYTLDQLWAQPDVAHGAKLMRQLYEDKDLYNRLSTNIKRDIKATLSYPAVGKLFTEVLEDVVNG